MSFGYQTIEKEYKIQYKEKGSNFIAFLFPIKTEKEFKDRLISLKKEFPDATHHCYGFRLDTSRNLDRSSDDGEPSGTAGKPILNQLISNELYYCALVVVRYFGGTKLGTGGLIKAYKEASKAVIEIAEIIFEKEKKNAKISFSFDLSSEVNKILRTLEAEIYKKEADEKLHLFISVPIENIEKLEQKLNELRFVSIILDPQ